MLRLRWVLLLAASAAAAAPERDDRCRSKVAEQFDNVTPVRRTLSSGYSASAGIGACHPDLLDIYVFMGASVTAVDVDLLLVNARRRGKIGGSAAPVEEAMRRHSFGNGSGPRRP